MAEQREGIFEGGRAKIGKQIVLPTSKAVEISLKSMKIRFWRSMITMSGIILAIAFLSFVWTTTAFEDGIRAYKPATPTEAENLEAVALEANFDLTAQVQGLDPENFWLVSLALMICVVGIVNSMLMSVTERIREIGTMKCLGALDGFIIKLFLLESSFQGIVGTVLGIVAGLLLSFMKHWITFGGFAFKAIPIGSLLLVLLFTLVIGAVLSVFAAIFPAYRAAKMQPVDAMRVEE